MLPEKPFIDKGLGLWYFEIETPRRRQRGMFCRAAVLRITVRNSV